MRKFATADCETDPFLFGRVPKPFIWGFYDGSNFRYFFKTEDFVVFIKDFDGIIYAHNGGKFDWHFLLEYIEPQNGIMIINGRIARLKIGNAELRDSFLLLPVPLSAYKKDEIDYSIFEENTRKAHMPEIYEYLKTDCIYLYEVLAANFEDYGQKLTLASSAFDFWASHFKEEKPRSNAAFYNWYKPYYYGGRVQCFEKGLINKPFKVFDIKSAYPYAMTFDHAWGTEYNVNKKIPDGDKMQRGFYHINARSNGVLPFRGENGLIFPDDNKIREYKVTGWEIAYGLESGRLKILDVISARHFSETMNFAPYVNYFYKLKESMRDIDAARYLLAKLYLNSLYGRMGIDPQDHMDYCMINPDEILAYKEAGYEFECELGKYALVGAGINPAHMRFLNVCVAASITGFVRAYLARHIYSCDTPIYCDTDSLACVGFNGIEGPDLGQWSFEGDFKRGAIGGKKLYAFEDLNGKYKISSKGAKLTEKEIFAIAGGAEIEYKNMAPTFSVKKGPEFITRRIKMT